MKDIRRRAELARVYAKYVRLGLKDTRLDAIDAYKRMIGASSCRGEAYSLIAMYDLIRYLSIAGKKEHLTALFEIYSPGKERVSLIKYSKNEVSMRVLSFAEKHHYDERTVWRMLSSVTELYYKLRNELSQKEN